METLTIIDVEERVERARSNFKAGYNCAQAVAMTFSDIINLPTEDVVRLAASFGGGIGRMRQTCGAACGLFLVAGLETGCTEGHNPQGKEANYKVVQELAEEFRKRNGSLICAELLGLAKNAPTPTTPDARNGEYYKKRPCVKMVEEAARIWCEYLENNKKEQ